MKLAIVSLGCPKNQVDADVFCHALLKEGHTTVPKIEQADAIIVNTCGFLDAAKEEAIEHILDACAVKKDRPDVKVVVTGCLAERYREEVAKEIPEVDAVVGIGKNGELSQIINELGKGQTPPNCVLEFYGPKTDLSFSRSRVIGTPMHYAYLKIAEGCSNACSYCAIPHIRGPMRSRDMEDCVQEAKWLAQQGVKELILVAQDVTAYGEDRGKNRIAELLDVLNTVEGIEWIRILYAYPEKITDAFIEAMACNDKVIAYLDLPIQHCNDEILSSMNRRGNKKTIQNAIEALKRRIPDITLRTSIITGYPGEAKAQFEELYQFVKDTRFERLGCFPYSQEEGTKAAQLPKQIPIEEREKRAQQIMDVQSRILLDMQESQFGKTQKILCDGYDEDEGYWVCRAISDAPEIDTCVFVSGDAPMEQGAFFLVKITEAQGLDLYAEYVSVAM